MVTKGVLWARIGYVIFAWLFMLGVVIQVLLVGLSLLGQMPLWDLHRDMGHTVGIALLPMLILAYVGRFPRAVKRQTWLLLGLYIVQAEVFATIRATLPLPAALHPVLAMLLFWLGVSVAQRAGALIRTPADAVAPIRPAVRQSARAGAQTL